MCKLGISCTLLDLSAERQRHCGRRQRGPKWFFDDRGQHLTDQCIRYITYNVYSKTKAIQRDGRNIRHWTFDKMFFFF